MKFKFRADPEDILIFVIFAIFLLYVVALGVSNLSTFASTGLLSGLNPLPAFSPKYILTTFVLYFLVLVVLLVGLYVFHKVHKNAIRKKRMQMHKK